jgi:hypothetical protein
MSKANSTAVAPPAYTTKPDTDDLPTLDRPGVVAYCAGFGLTVTERFVRQCSQDGTLPSFVVRNRVMFSRADVHEWLRSLRRG